MSLQLGSQIDDYRLEEVLGRGGMGCVYRATHTRLGRTVALKVLSHTLVSSSEYVSRFLSEAKIVNSVRHPNIVDIHDFIEHDEPRLVAYVMEFISGPSLGQALKKGALTVRQSLNATLQLAAALEAVHGMNVVHRDLKPDNILVLAPLDSDFSNVPSIKILDFGIAKHQSPEIEHKTVTGSMLGTPSYMAPEQIAGEKVSHKTDIYAIGEILYEMLLGRRLFFTEPVVTLKRKLVGERPDVSALEKLSCGPRLHALVEACLEHDCEKRPTIGDLAGEVTLALHELGSGICAPVEQLVQPEYERTDTPVNMVSMIAPPPAKSHRPLMMGAGLLALACGAGVIALGQQSNESAPHVSATSLAKAPTPTPHVASGTPEAPKPPQADETEKPQTPVATPQSRKVLVQSTPSGAVVTNASTKKPLGVTPLEVEVAPQETVELRLERKGYRTKRLKLDERSENTQVRLHAIHTRRHSTISRSARRRKPVKRTVKKSLIKKRELVPW